jgi:ferredoxin-NADP reductase
MTTRADAVDVVVTKITPLTNDVKQFDFARVDGGEFRKFSAGSHIVISSPDGSTCLRNTYTLTSDPDDMRTYSITVSRQESGRGGSKFLHDHVSVGDRFSLRLPQNYFSTDKRASRHLFIAGGIGITPFISMLSEAEAMGQPAELHFATRDEELPDAVNLAYFGCRKTDVESYVSSRGQRMDIAALLTGAPIGTHVYVCGPERLVDSVLAEAKALNWPASNIHVELFQVPVGGEPFRVAIAGKREAVHVGSEESLLDALEDAGVAVNSLCRVGVCGECVLHVSEKEGSIIHRDKVLSENERNAGCLIMPCVSRFSGAKLVVEQQ